MAGSDGAFEITDCPSGYHLLLVRNRSDEEHWVPAPKPEASLEVNITLAGARPVEPLAVTAATSPTPASRGAFHVCQNKGEAVWELSGATLEPNGSPLDVDSEPHSVNVYVASWPVGYAVYVDRREPASPLSPARPPAGYYQFTDETSDTYLLVAILPYLHSTWYTSAKPNILHIKFTQGIPYSGAWPNAPICE